MPSAAGGGEVAGRGGGARSDILGVGGRAGGRGGGPRGDLHEWLSAGRPVNEQTTMASFMAGLFSGRDKEEEKFQEFSSGRCCTGQLVRRHWKFLGGCVWLGSPLTCY